MTPKCLDIQATDAIQIPVGTNDQRPGDDSDYATVRDGMIRYNTDTNKFEGYSSSNWSSLGGVENVDSNTKIVASDSSYELMFFSGDNSQVTATSSDRTEANMILDASGHLNLQNGSVININTSESDVAIINLVSSDGSGIVVEYDETPSSALTALTDAQISGLNESGQSYTVTSFSDSIFDSVTGSVGEINKDVDITGSLTATSLS